MLSLKLLQDTKHPPLRLLDMAFIIVLLPLMLVLKVPMMIFTFMVLGILFFKQTQASKHLILTFESTCLP